MDYGHANEAEKQEINHLIALVEKNANNSKLLTRLGAMLFVVCNFPPHEASDYLQHAIALDPSNINALFWLAKCLYHDLFDSQKAKQYLEQALILDPHRADCLSLMADVLSDLKSDPELILSYTDMAIAAAPRWIIPRKQRINLLIKLNRLEEAKKEIYETKKLIPHRLSVPIDSVEEYYEIAVTGCSSSYIEKRLNEYLDIIAQKNNK